MEFFCRVCTHVHGANHQQYRGSCNSKGCACKHSRSSRLSNVLLKHFQLEVLCLLIDRQKPFQLLRAPRTRTHCSATSGVLTHTTDFSFRFFFLFSFLSSSSCSSLMLQWKGWPRDVVSVLCSDEALYTINLPHLLPFACCATSARFFKKEKRVNQGLYTCSSFLRTLQYDCTYSHLNFWFIPWLTDLLKKRHKEVPHCKRRVLFAGDEVRDSDVHGIEVRRC